MEALYPFLFYVNPDVNKYIGTDKPKIEEKWIVIIANPFDYRFAETRWMEDKDLPEEYTLEPGLDLIHSKHFFDTELDAILFIKKWWKEDKNWVSAEEDVEDLKARVPKVVCKEDAR